MFRCFPWPYLIGLLLDDVDLNDKRLVDVMNLTEACEACEAAVPGRVGGFILNGACGLSGGAREGGGFFTAVTSDELVDGLIEGAVLPVGVGGNGRFGGSVAGGVFGRSSSFDGGNGGIDNLNPFPFSAHKLPNPISFSNPNSFSILQSGPAPFGISQVSDVGGKVPPSK